MASLKDLNAKLDAAAEGSQPWKANKEGDQIAGVITVVGSFTHAEYGTSPTLTIETEDGTMPAGALVSTVIRADADGIEGSYVDYIGVHRRARGRGIAKALLHSVIADASRRGRNRIGLEVDAGSPIGADGLYTAMGWVTDYRTESWHHHLEVLARP